MEDEEESLSMKEETQQILKVLEALKQASQQLKTNPSANSSDSSSLAIKVLLELETESDSLLSSDPNLSNLSHHISDLKTLISSLQKTKHKHGVGGIRSFLTRRVKTHEITRVAESIESEIQAWIDRETITNLTTQLQQVRSKSAEFDEDELVEKLDQLYDRLSQGFDINLQDLLLKSRIFSELEWLLCCSKSNNVSQRVREKVGYALKEVVLFNKDVFVGQVLVGQTIKALVFMDSLCSLEVLCSLVKAIRSPLVDVIESVGGISKMVFYLSSQDLEMKIRAMDCVLEIGYFGRKEAVEAMLNEGLIKKLVELQRSELGGDLIDLGKAHEKIEEDEKDIIEEEGVDVKKKKKKKGYREKKFFDRHPFASCVVRFAVQLEVGEGLRQREKRAFKQEILKKIREASASDAEAATIVAEILWGSSP